MVKQNYAEQREAAFEGSLAHPPLTSSCAVPIRSLGVGDNSYPDGQGSVMMCKREKLFAFGK